MQPTEHRTSDYMDRGRQKSFIKYVPGLTNNAVLKLIIASGSAFVMLGICWGIILIVYQNDRTNFYHYFINNLALPPIADFKTHWWTIFTYGWFHFSGFWELLSNMLWLYCFGSVVQMLIGHRQIIPLYAYALTAGGIFYVVAQLLPGSLHSINQNLLGPHQPGVLGARAGMVAMAAAAVTISPNFRFYLTETFRIHILVVAGIFTLLMLLSTGFKFPEIMLLAGGALTGFAYVRVLKAGYRPGQWMYVFSSRVEGLVTPNEAKLSQKKGIKIDILTNKYKPKSGISQQNIDDILDKINQKGYKSLTAEEKEILMRAGKE